jgi:hypothetical protein
MWCLSLKEGEPRDRIIGLCHGLSRTYYLYDVGISLVFLDRRIELFYLELVQNVGLLVSLVVIHGQIIRRWNKYTFGSKAFFGFLFGGVAVVGMMTPVHLMPGYDV